MSFVRGNLAIRDHVSTGKDLHLFEYVGKGNVRYVGQMICTGFHERRGPDVKGDERRVIVFELTPVDAFGAGLISTEDCHSLRFINCKPLELYTNCCYPVELP